MKEEITTAERATEIALAFAKKHWFLARPIKASKEDGAWLVDVDVGALETKIGRIKIDAQTGKILEYNVPFD